MNFQREIAFFKRIAQQLHLYVYTLPGDNVHFPVIDLGIRSELGLPVASYDAWKNQLQQKMQCNVIYQITDEFSCKYTALRLPDSTEAELLIVGPYITEEINQPWLQNYILQRNIHTEWLPVLTEYFRRVPYLHSEELLTSSVNALAECLFGTQKYSWEHIISGVSELWIPLTTLPDSRKHNDALSDINALERRYEGENRLIQVISQGRSHTAELMLANFSQAALVQRASEPSRNAKNYTVILNTLMRKAAEQGGVHPIYIDSLSSEFAVRIETLSVWKEFTDLWQEMARKYCLLVKKHANREYSSLVQKVIARVDFDLAADLSLKANAEALNVNASYLSTLFKKETGCTLTDYVNRKRIEHAIFLLNTTTLSISAVGQRSGIQDDNYFTKIFKKYTNKTPTQYRQDNNRLSK